MKAYPLSIKEKLLTISALALLCLSSLAYSETFVEGKHYRVMENPGIPQVPGKIEVREFFWYGCPHCYTLEGKLTEWKKNLPDDVNFVASPAIAAPHWKLLGNAYLAAQNMGIAEESHAAVFAALHKDRKNLSSPDQVAEFYSQFGVEKEAFLDQMSSFSVKTAARRAENLFRQYKLTGTPALIVNGKYQPVSRSYDELLRIVDFLIEKERQAMDSGA